MQYVDRIVWMDVMVIIGHSLRAPSMLIKILIAVLFGYATEKEQQEQQKRKILIIVKVWLRGRTNKQTEGKRGSVFTFYPSTSPLTLTLL